MRRGVWVVGGWSDVLGWWRGRLPGAGDDDGDGARAQILEKCSRFVLGGMGSDVSALCTEANTFRLSSRHLDHQLVKSSAPSHFVRRQIHFETSALIP